MVAVSSEAFASQIEDSGLGAAKTEVKAAALFVAA